MHDDRGTFLYWSSTLTKAVNVKVFDHHPIFGCLTIQGMLFKKVRKVCDVQPARLLQPVRHALGYVLLRAGKAAEAEEVYRDNLAEHPDNGFGLFGLSQSLAAQGRRLEAEQVMESQFQQAWKFSDYVLNSSIPAFSV